MTSPPRLPEESIWSWRRSFVVGGRGRTRRRERLCRRAMKARVKCLGGGLFELSDLKAVVGVDQMGAKETVEPIGE